MKGINTREISLKGIGEYSFIMPKLQRLISDKTGYVPVDFRFASFKYPVSMCTDYVSIFVFKHDDRLIKVNEYEGKHLVSMLFNVNNNEKWVSIFMPSHELDLSWWDRPGYFNEMIDILNSYFVNGRYVDRLKSIRNIKHSIEVHTQRKVMNINISCTPISVDVNDREDMIVMDCTCNRPLRMKSTSGNCFITMNIKGKHKSIDIMLVIDEYLMLHREDYNAEGYWDTLKRLLDNLNV